MRYRIVNKKLLLATMAADVLGKVVFCPRKLWSRQRDILPDDVQSILIIRTAYIGDVVMALPILHPIKKRFPQARITFLTSESARPVLENHPLIDHIITYDPFWFYGTPKRAYLECIRGLRGHDFDLVIETRGDIRDILLLVAPLKAEFKVGYGAGGGGYLLTHVVPYAGPLHRVDYHLGLARALGCPVDGVERGICLREEEWRDIHALMRDRDLTPPFVCVHPGSRMPLKRWPSGRFSSLCDRIVERHKLPIVIIGSADERSLAEEIAEKMENAAVNLAGHLALRQLAGLLSTATLMVCNDSAPMHIAAEMGTSTVAIFGPSNSPETGPYGEGHCVVEVDLSCRSGCDERRCRNQTPHACMSAITVEEVLQAVDSAFAALRHP